MPKLSSKYGIYIVLLFLGLELAAQETYKEIYPNLKENHIGSSKGLSSQLCRTMIEDSLGNLWIGNYYELNKYNGFQNKIFDSHNSELRTKVIFDLAIDALNRVWVFQKDFVTITHIDITVFDPVTNVSKKITEIVPEWENEINKVEKIWIRDNTIYLLTASRMLYSFSDELKKILELDPSFSYIELGKDKIIHTIRDGVWTTRDFENKVIKTHSYSSNTEDAMHILNDQGYLLKLSRTSDNTYDVYCYEDTSWNRKNVKFLDREFNPFFLQKTPFFYFLDGEKKVHLINRRIYVDDDTSHFFNYFDKPNARTDKVFFSKTGILTTATNKGVFLFDFDTHNFDHFKTDDEIMNSTRGLLMDDDLRMYKFKEREHIESPNGKYDLGFLKDLLVSRESYAHLREHDNKNRVWSLGIDQADKVRLIDFEEQKYFFFESENRLKLEGIIKTKKGKFLVYGVDGLFKYKDKVFRRVKDFQEKSESGNTCVNHILETSNCLLLATCNGLKKYFPSTDSIAVDPIWKDNLNYKIEYIHQDKKDSEIYWLGTLMSGLLKFNAKEQTVERFSLEDGLANNSIHFIYEDKLDRLWFSTNKYLHCVDKDFKNIKVITPEEGITDAEFNRKSFYYNEKDNRLYLGGLNGYNAFCPDSLFVKKNEEEINIRLVSAKKISNDGENKDILVSAIQDQNLKILERDFSIQLGLSTDHLIKVDNSVFSYRIDKISDKWTNIKDNTLIINRLPYGKYKLEIVSDIYKPNSQSNIYSIDLHYIKPFYKQGLFIALLILGTLLLLYYGYRLRVNAIELKNLELENIVKERTFELNNSNETKNKLFAILAHDLRSPLTSLKNLSQKIKYLHSENRMDDLELILDSTESRINSLEDNLNNILLWAISEKGTLASKKEYFNPYKLVEEIILLYQEDIKKKKLSVINNIPIDESYLTDKTVFQAVIRNLVSNSIKYNYDNGEVVISTVDAQPDYIIVSIKDNGPGINSSSTNSGTGLGLKIAGDLCELVEGEITIIERSDSRGTDAQFKFPKIKSLEKIP